MRTARLTFLAGCLGAVFCTGCGGSSRVPAAAVQVTAIADDYLAALVVTRPDAATLQGVSSADHAGITDNSRPAIRLWQAKENAWLTRLAAIDTASLAGRPEAVTWVVLNEELESARALRVCQDEIWGVNSYVNGWQNFYSDVAMAQPVGSDSLRARALARLHRMPKFIENEVANLREGVSLGYTSPRVIVRAVIGQMDNILALPPAQSPYASPAQRDSTPAFRTAYLAAIDAELNPALRAYRDFLEKEYLPKAREAIGLSANPEGGECYRARVRASTSIEIAPEQISRIGLDEMAKVEDEMRAVSARSFGGMPVPDLLQRLKTDPRYTFRTSAEVIAYAQEAMDKAEAALPRAFGLTTKARVVIQPYPEFRAKAGAPGQYNAGPEDGSRPGVYLINAFDPSHTSRATIQSTTFHETWPGHHFQISIARERKNLHPIARFLGSAGYIEGWGLYAEGVADELGLYTSDVDRMGWLASRAFRAARLVIDAGIHAKGMTRDEAVSYLRTHSTRSPSEVEGEVNRYISMGGQATAYMLGNRELLRLRERARTLLGGKFDVRAFHDHILEDGSLPLPALRTKVEGWLASERAKP